MKAEERLVRRLRRLARDGDSAAPLVQDLRGILFQYDVDKSLDRGAESRAGRVTGPPAGRIFPQLAYPE